jgi:hypothetical protein
VILGPTSAAFSPMASKTAEIRFSRVGWAILGGTRCYGCHNGFARCRLASSREVGRHLHSENPALHLAPKPHPARRLLMARLRA